MNCECKIVRELVIRQPLTGHNTICSLCHQERLLSSNDVVGVTIGDGVKKLEWVRYVK